MDDISTWVCLTARIFNRRLARMKNQLHVNLALSAIVVLGLAWIWFSRDPQGTTTNGTIPAPQTGFMAPDFSLEDAEGQVITLSSLRGKPVLLNFWATWCPPCRSEMPAMQELLDEYADEGFTILAVNATNQDDLDQVNSFVQEHHLQFPILLDLAGQAFSLYEIRSLPTSFFLNDEGIIEEVIIGGMSEAFLRTRVESLLKNFHVETP